MGLSQAMGAISTFVACESKTGIIKQRYGAVRSDSTYLYNEFVDFNEWILLSIWGIVWLSISSS